MVLILFIWIAGNIPNRVDVEWVKRGGGIIGHDHPPAYRFNAGQKMIFWIQVLGGTAMIMSGYILIFPFYGTGVAGMELASVVHAIVAMLYIAAMIGHIYIGTLGMEGAFEAMGRAPSISIGPRNTTAFGWRKKKRAWVRLGLKASPWRPGPRNNSIF